jgi:hypothetical protein
VLSEDDVGLLPVIAFGPGAHKEGSINPLCASMRYGF